MISELGIVLIYVVTLDIELFMRLRGDPGPPGRERQVPCRAVPVMGEITVYQSRGCAFFAIHGTLSGERRLPLLRFIIGIPLVVVNFRVSGDSSPVDTGIDAGHEHGESGDDSKIR